MPKVFEAPPGFVLNPDYLVPELRAQRDALLEALERFAALVAAAEREACAKLAEATICDTHLPTGVRIYGTRAAAAIRARGNT